MHLRRAQLQLRTSLAACGVPVSPSVRVQTVPDAESRVYSDLILFIKRVKGELEVVSFRHVKNHLSCAQVVLSFSRTNSEIIINIDRKIVVDCKSVPRGEGETCL